MTAEKFFTHRAGVAVAATAAMLLWGSAFPAVKLGYEAWSIGSGDVFRQILFAGYRFFLAGILILLFMKTIRKPAGYRRGSAAALCKIAAVGTFLQYVFFYVGISISSGVHGSIISGTISFFQILLAHFMYRNDALNLRKTIGLLLGFAGIALVGLSGSEGHFRLGAGEICLLTASFFSALGNIFTKNESARADVLYITSYQMLLGGLALIATGASRAGLFPFSFNLEAALLLLYLAFLSAAGFVLWNLVMKYNRVGNVSVYMFLIPVFGVALSAVFLQEALRFEVFLSLALVVCGIVIVNRKPGPAAVK